MKKVADTLHLEKRKGIYHYRRRVPDELIAAIGKKTIKQSLKTTAIVEARKLRNLLDVRWDDEFQLAAAGLATGSQQTIIPHSGGKDANGIGRTDVISRVGLLTPARHAGGKGARFMGNTVPRREAERGWCGPSH